MINSYKLVNGQNYFNTVSLQEMIDLLDGGDAIQIYIDCIGHARTEYETAQYVQALKERYGDKLQADSKTTYKLKE